MAKKTRSGGGEIGINMTPMIDCTFQLILFFVLAAKISEAELEKMLVSEPHKSKAVPPATKEGEEDFRKMPNKLIVNVVNEYGKGRTAYVPWAIGWHYEKFPTHCHERLMLSIVRDLMGYDCWLRTDLPPTVEINSQVRRDGAWQLVSLVNLSGQNGRAVLDPVTVAPGTMQLRLKAEVVKARALRAECDCAVEKHDDGSVSVAVPSLDLLETIVVEPAN